MSLSHSVTKFLSEYPRDKAFLALGFVAVVFVTFGQFFDPSILRPGNVGWIMAGDPETHGDLRQHYLGWVAIRQADTLGSPIGASPLLAYPYGAPISSTDSNPLVSLLLWPLRNVLPADFQFIGPWYLLSLTLSLFFAFKLLRHAEFDRLTALALATVLAYPPILFWRYGHDTLTAQWLILAAIYVSFAVKVPTRAILYHAGLLFLAMTIHPYLFIMLNFVVGFDLLARIVQRGGIKFGQVERLVLAFVAVQIAAMTAGVKLGVFALEQSFDLPIGVFSTDPLGLFNPFESSRLMPQLPAGEGQYEGYAYLGLGGIVLLGYIGVMAIRGTLVLNEWRMLLPLFGAALVAWAFAISPVVTILGNEVFNANLADDSPIRSVFSKLRSSGRFVWITTYVLLFAALLCLPRQNVWKLRGFAVVLFALQMWDLEPLQRKSLDATAWREAPQSIFDEPEWQDRIARADFIYMARDLGLEFSLDVGAAAFPLNTPLTWFYTAQGLGLPKQIAAEEQQRIATLNGTHEPKGLYILDSGTEMPFLHRRSSGFVTTHPVEDFHVLATEAFTTELILKRETHGVTELLEWCETACSAFVVAHQNAEPKLSLQVKAYMAGKGGRISDIAPKGSYAVVLRDGEIIEEELDPLADSVINVTLGDVPISMRSSVEDAKLPSSINFGGIEFARETRGLSVLLVKDDGRIVTAAFDTVEESDSLYPDDSFDDLDQAAKMLAAALPSELAKDLPSDLTRDGIEDRLGFIHGRGSHADPFINRDRYLTEESSLLDVLSGCRQGCMMALSVKDEASASMPLAARIKARQMGLTLADLEFRDGYAAIVENGIVLSQGRSHQEVVDLTETVADKRVRAVSAGFEAGSTSSITIDGQDHSLGHRGMNIVVMLDGERIISYHFDTHGGF